MLGNFYESFKKKDNDKKLPKSVEKVLKADLPTGFVLLPDAEHPGHVLIVPDPTGKEPIQLTFNIEAKEFEDFPEWAKKNQDTIMDYLYRTQRHVKVSNAAFKKTDGSTVRFQDIFTDPLGKKQEIREERFEIVPDKFPDPKPMIFNLEDDTNIILHFQRVPYDCKNQIKFHNTDHNEIDMTWIIPDFSRGNKEKSKQYPSTMQLKVTPTKAASVHDANMAMKLLKGYFTGTVRLNDNKINKGFIENQKVDLEKVENQITYWSNLERLEQILDVSFNPAIEPENPEVRLYYHLVKCFLEDQALIFKKPISYFTVNKDALDDPGFKGAVQNHTPHAFAYISDPENYKLLGAKFDLYSANIMKNIIFDHIEMDGDRGKVFIKSAKEDDPWKLYRKYTLSQEQASIELDKMSQEYIRPRVDD